jgi:hypothetical protein
MPPTPIVPSSSKSASGAGAEATIARGSLAGGSSGVRFSPDGTVVAALTELSSRSFIRARV